MKKFFIFIFISLAIVLGGFIYFSPIFEKEPPKIEVLTNGYTNLTSIKIKIYDNSGIKSYNVILIANNRAIELDKNESVLKKDLLLNIKLPKVDAKTIKLIIKAKDTSKWNFFAGNKSKKEVTLKVDTSIPEVDVIDNSYAIGRGGSAVAIVKAKDNNLKDVYILVNNKYKFKLTPFVKKNYYISLIAWPYTEKTFSADLVAIDLANNKAKIHIPYYWRTKGIYKFKTKKITISDELIKKVAIRVLSKENIPIPKNNILIFKKLNEDLREKNEKEIFNITSKTDANLINSFYIRRFKPLPGSKKMADFGEKRYYYYHHKLISKSIHKGIDLAKIKRAKIYSSNNGIVIANKYIGIYGNVLIIYHKLGLYSLYAHTSKFLVKKGNLVKKGEIIAKTGATGAVFGDHLHFGIYIQGWAVNPREWMDERWIRLNILNIIKRAKKSI